jgi:5-methyltetrahydropteroyltriglutamate--homocysteine methyltransferase
VQGVIRSVHFCYGDFEARTWARNRLFAPILPTIQALAGIVDRVVLEFSLPEQWAQRELLREIPEAIAVAAGIVDVKEPRIETAAEIRQKAEELLRYVPMERLLLCPSCGFGRRNVGMAISKTTAMVEAARSTAG